MLLRFFVTLSSNLQLLIQFNFLASKWPKEVLGYGFIQFLRFGSNYPMVSNIYAFVCFSYLFLARSWCFFPILNWYWMFWRLKNFCCSKENIFAQKRLFQPFSCVRIHLTTVYHLISINKQCNSTESSGSTSGPDHDRLLNINSSNQIIRHVGHVQ